MLRNLLFLTLLSVIIIGALVTAIFLWDDKTSSVTTTSSELQSPPKKKPTPNSNSVLPVDKSPPNKAAPNQHKKIIIPSFDLVQIMPDGNAVIAGRAAPNSKIVIVDNEQTLGQLNANSQGDWVFIPKSPFKPGSHQLSLKMLIDGQKTAASEDVVVLVVPEPKKDISGRKTKKELLPLAFKFSKKDGASSVLQKPTGDTGIGPLSVDTVDYNDAGQLIISGQATPKTSVIVYLNNLVIGKSVVGRSGSGKSTFLKLILGEMDVSGGAISWEGQSILGPKNKLVSGHDFMKYVPQEF